ncbi:unnamed protein product [Meganyctiphanes norvegica]|uniref:C-type lectin domain-containing protein n=1 Tax=Meganyctiphanes norvegica TaxID=48144 RepID=A0AAV2RCC4_MEGNR
MAECDSCPFLFTEIGRCCYLFSSEISQTAITWSDARQACQNLGIEYARNIDLAEVGTSSTCTGDVDFMQRISDKGHHVWMGASDIDQEDNWVWMNTGKPLLDTNNMWDLTHPNGGTSMNCMRAFVNGTHRRPYFMDDSCTDTNHYVCQIVV